MSYTAAALICFFWTASVCAQTPPSTESAKPSFEVASIKPSKTSGKPSLRVFPGGRTVATNATLKYLIGLAYGVRDYQIIGGPQWIDSAEYDIEAKPPEAFQPSLSTRTYAMKTLQSLLEDRFQLTILRTTKELPLYTLTVSKSGSKMKERTQPENPSDMKMTGGRGLMVGQGLPIEIVVESLSSVLGRPVKDATGLRGFYDFRLQWTPDDIDPNSTGADGGPSLFAALQEQLGLRLEAGRGPVDAFTVESAMQPSEN